MFRMFVSFSFGGMGLSSSAQVVQSSLQFLANHFGGSKQGPKTWYFSGTTGLEINWDTSVVLKEGLQSYTLRLGPCDTMGRARVSDIQGKHLNSCLILCYPAF